MYQNTHDPPQIVAVKTLKGVQPKNLFPQHYFYTLSVISIHVLW